MNLNQEKKSWNLTYGPELKDALTIDRNCLWSSPGAEPGFEHRGGEQTMILEKIYMLASVAGPFRRIF
jgi:hypothetical protein